MLAYVIQNTSSITAYHNLPLADIPALAALHAQLIAAGWILRHPERLPKLVISQTLMAGEPQYRVKDSSQYIHTHNQANLIVCTSTPTQTPTPEEARTAATATIFEIYNYPHLIPMGRGQLTQARAEAVRLLAVAETLPHLPATITTCCETRGGRGGRLAKTLHKTFTPAELKSPPKPTRAQKYPHIRCLARIGHAEGENIQDQTESQRTLYLHPNGHIHYNTWGQPYAVDSAPTALNGQPWRIARYTGSMSNSVYTLAIPESDYQRLITKQQAQLGIKSDE